MCGIAGFIGAGDRAVLVRMTSRLLHRGPDDAGFLIDYSIAAYLGFRRLAILDISGGRQPMSTADDALSIVFNGEIYNWRELRRELTGLGAHFQTDHSDTEVLLHGYRQWGENLPNHLNGMWAFAILDRRKKRAFLSRDRFGKKPLFYFASDEVFAFASELTALREHPAMPSTLSQRALRKYFGYGYVPAPLTFFEGVCKLPAGHNLAFDLRNRSLRMERYWQYRSEPFEERPANAEARWSEELSAYLDAAVARRLIADVPVGAFLSGGLDSSLVAALALRHAGADRIKTFSIGFEEATFDESRYARMVAEHIGADHQAERLSIQRALGLLPEIAARWDEPIADSSLLPTYLLCRHARRQVTVALGGDGADELFAGYDAFRALRYAQAWARCVPRPVHNGIAMLAAKLPVSHRRMSFDFLVKRTLRGLGHLPHLWLPMWLAPLAPSDLEQLFNEPVDPEDVFSEAILAWDACDSKDPVERTIAFYVRLYLQDDILVKVDRASMLNSLEVRAPFLDYELVDFLRRLPSDMKLRGGTTKYLLRKIAAPLLPPAILSRSKHGFTVPIGKWFRDGAMPARRPGEAINPRFWQDRLARHRKQGSDERAYLWSDWLLGSSHIGSTGVDA